MELEVVGLILSVSLGSMGLAALLVKDHLDWRVRQGLPYFPDWVRKGFILITIILLVAGMVLPGLGRLFSGALISAILFFISFSRFGNGRKNTERAKVLLEISEALRHRVPLAPFLQVLGREYRTFTAEGLKYAGERVSSGATLSQALEAGDLAPPHLLAAIRAGEVAGGGALPEVLRQGAQQLLQETASRARILLVLLYPLAVWAVCVPMALYTLGYILPRYDWMLGTSFRRLPVVAWWPVWYSTMWSIVVGAAFLVVLFVGYGLWGTREEIGENRSWLEAVWKWMRDLGRLLVDQVPLLRARQRGRCLARAARLLSALTRAGQPLPEACRQASDPELSGPFAPAFSRLAAAARQGVPVNKALESSGLPPNFLWLAIAGVEGGVFPQAMESVAEWQEAQVRRLDGMLVVVLPFITIPLAAVLVGSIYIGVLAMLNSLSSGYGVYY